MKRIIIALACASGLLFGADENAPDSSVTRIPLSGVKFYNIVDEMQAQNEEGFSPQLRSDRPFAFRQPDDRWFSHDKWMHLTTSFFITLQSTYLMEEVFFSEPEAARNISVGLSFSLALGKEFYDVFEGESIFSWKDLIYDVIGTSLGYVTAVMIQR